MFTNSDRVYSMRCDAMRCDAETSKNAQKMTVATLLYRTRSNKKLINRN